MSDAPANPLDQPWEDVTITLLYQDGPKIEARTVRLNRSEIEASERQHYLAQAQQLDAEDPRRDEAIAQAEAWELTPEMFQDRIVNNVENMATAPLRLPGDEPHTFRILPPWAVREVRVSIDNAKSVIVVPRA